MGQQVDYTKIFHTVPYSQESIYRDKEGKKNKLTPLGTKVVDGKTIAEWDSFTIKRNTNNTPILGAIALEDFIGIDIDNNELFDLLYKYAPECTYVAASLPVTLNKGGHLLFSYDKQQAVKLSMMSQALKDNKIDVQIGKKLIYLATFNNQTKKLITPELTALSDLTPMPDDFLAQLSLIALPKLHEKMQARVGSYSNATFPETSYGYMLNIELTPKIVNALTPKIDFPQIKRMDDIPKGSATEWATQVRQKLIVDPTVSPEVFKKTVRYLYSLWSTTRGPMAQMDSDIKRDLRHVQWVYDETWQAKGMTYPNKLGQTIEIFYDYEQALFISHNKQTDKTNVFDKQTTVVNAIVNTHRSRQKFTGEQILKKAQTVKIVNTPELPSRLSVNSELEFPAFNTFAPSEGAAILQGVITPKDLRHPEHILKFFENLIPDEATRNRFLRYLAYKHTSYEYSPLYFVLAGVGGAGKGVLIEHILTYFSGRDRYILAKPEMLNNNFNSWMSTTDWAQIDEAGEGYSNREAEKLVGNLKTLTGSPTLTIERKGKDINTTPQRHYITPIISTNLRTKLITDTMSNDRRMVFIKCPNKMAKITDDTRDYLDKMKEELPYFAYYLRNLKTLNHSAYHSNAEWKNDDYKAYISDTISFSDKLLEAAENRDLSKFIEELKEINVSYKQIDEMFSLSIENRPARCLVYNTAGTKAYNMISLQDIFEENAMLSGLARQVFSTVKIPRSISKNGHNASAQVIEFDDNYIKLKEDIQPVSNADDIEI